MHMHSFHKVRWAALALVVLTASVAAHAARGTNEGGVSLTCTKPIAASYTQIKFVCTTNVPTTLSVATGATNNQNDAVPTTDRLKTHHTLYVRGLSPNTLYYAWVAATAKDGQKSPTLKSGTPTWAPGTAPATVTSKGNKLLLNGQPTMLTTIRTDNPCPDQGYINNLVGLKGIGVNVLVDYNSALAQCAGGDTNPAQWASSLHGLLQNKLWWQVRVPSQYQALQAQKLPELINWQAATTTVDAGPAGGDSLGFIANSCKELGTLYGNATRTGANRVLLFTITISDRYPGSRVNCTTLDSMAAEFWVISQNGGSVSWFTRDDASQNDFQPFSGAQAEAHKLTQQRGTLGPVILYGKSVAVSASSASSVKFKAWQYGGLYYVHATNTAKTSTTSNFTVGALTKGGTAQVMFEGKSLKIKPGAVPVTLAPFGNKWYKITPNK